MADLENSFVKNQSQYPDTVAEGHTRLICYQKHEPGSSQPIQAGLAFAPAGHKNEDPNKSKSNIDKETNKLDNDRSASINATGHNKQPFDGKCHYCKQSGHWIMQCSLLKQSKKKANGNDSPQQKDGEIIHTEMIERDDGDEFHDATDLEDVNSHVDDLSLWISGSGGGLIMCQITAVNPKCCKGDCRPLHLLARNDSVVLRQRD